jgi:asparagine synthase (glutamine-hydrolysing)
MCGIVGVVSAAGVDAAAVARMRERLAHRGPDDAGLWRSADGRVCLGHRRLSIIDLDARAAQPMRSHDGRLVVTYNGEIYNYRAVRGRLEAEGVCFRTQSDTEVLLEAYRRWGEGALERLSGMFAFALWDESERRLLCARDRAGEKPFYYGLAGGAFVFASEPKALLDWPGLDRRVDYEALVDFLAFGFVADPKSAWRGLRRLAPAHAMTVELRDDGDAILREPRRYWSLAFTARPRQADAEEIRATLLRATDEMAVSDVPLGTFLSGGVDSSAVTAALSLSGHPVSSYTIGFEHAAYDERPWARRVAERYRTAHTERLVDSADAAAVIDRLAWHYDEPFNDYSNVPTYYLCREARKSITVALSGDGADELFAGYRKYQRLARRAELRGAFPVGVARPLAALARCALREGSAWRRTLSQYGMAAPQMLADMLCTGFTLAQLRAAARGPLAEALRHYDPHRLVEHLLRDAPPEEVGLVNAMRHLDFALTLPGDILVKVDRASMAVSLEVRPPFLHRDVMELAAGLEPAALASRSAAKLALKAALRPWLPEALLERRKQGFAMPLPEWLSGDPGLAGRFRAGGRGSAVAEILDSSQLARFAAAHARGAGNFTAIVHSEFVLEQWFARWAPAV